MAQQRDSYSYFDAVGSDYLPGEYYRRSLGTLTPTELAQYHAKLRWDFKEPKSKSSTDQFMGLVRDPAALQNVAFNRLPSDFVNKLQMFGGLGGFSNFAEQ